MADDANKLEFRKKMFEKYAKCKKNLFPREVYNSTIEDLKLASQVSSSKSGHDYCILNKYKVEMLRSSSRKVYLQKILQFTMLH